MLKERLAHSEELRAQVMEVKAHPGMSNTTDVIEIKGHLKEGDTILVPGVEGPIVTQIRGLLLPPPMKELRVKVSKGGGCGHEDDTMLISTDAILSF